MCHDSSYHMLIFLLGTYFCHLSFSKSPLTPHTSIQLLCLYGNLFRPRLISLLSHMSLFSMTLINFGILYFSVLSFNLCMFLPIYPKVHEDIDYIYLSSVSNVRAKHSAWNIVGNRLYILHGCYFEILNFYLFFLPKFWDFKITHFWTLSVLDKSSNLLRKNIIWLQREVSWKCRFPYFYKRKIIIC